VLILTGWAATAWYWPLAVYTVVVAVAFHLRVLWYEEPILERSFGDDWRAYRRRVGRWLGSNGRAAR
jgi:protein-S-isoprenylcysteine O-methyltransferase Ste14